METALGRKPCVSCDEGSRARYPGGKQRNAVWIVTCMDARVFWGVSADPDHENDVLFWHPAASYGDATKQIDEAKSGGGWPAQFIKKDPW